MGRRSNLFSNVENKYKFANKQQIIEMSLNATYNLLGAVEFLDDNATFGIMVVGARLGVSGDGVINKDEKDLIDEIFSRAEFCPLSEVYELLKGPLSGSEYDMVPLLSQMGNHVVMAFLHYVLCFAYADGVFEDDVAEKLDGTLGMNLLADFMESGQEEVPAQRVRLTGIEAEMVCWFRENNEMYNLQTIKKHFSDCPPSEVQRALDRLVEKGVVYGGANFIDNLYGLCDADEAWNYDIDDESIRFEKERVKKLEEEARRKDEEARNRKEELARRAREEQEKREEAERIRQAEIDEYRKAQEERRKAQEERRKAEETRKKEEEARLLREAEEARKAEFYEKAMSYIESGDLSKCREAVELLSSIQNWKDAYRKMSNLRKQIEIMEAELAEKKEKDKKIFMGVLIVLLIAAGIFLMLK